jgi:hypothetical protein
MKLVREAVEAGTTDRANRWMVARALCVILSEQDRERLWLETLLKAADNDPPAAA